MSRADILQKYEKYCEDNCPYSKKQREFMCSSCMMGAAIEIVENLPLVTPAISKGEFTRQELESWLYSISLNNIGTDLCEYVLEIISRLDGFEKYVENMRQV